MLDKIIKEIKEVGTITIFFLIVFGLILILMKLFLNQYSIKIYVLSKIIIAALVASKTVIIMDKTKIIKGMRLNRLYLCILYKTAIYTVTVFSLGILEKLLIHHIPLKTIIQDATFSHFLAVNICICIVFLIYNIYDEIDNYLGKGSLQKILFSKPKKQ
jgi:hypothetical protein